MGTSSVVDTWKNTPVNASLPYADPTTRRAEFPESGGLAKGTSVRTVGLSIDRIVSRPGEVRALPSDAPGRRFCPSQHRRRFRQTQSGRESPILKYRRGFTGGVPLLPDPRPRPRLRPNRLADGRAGRSQPFTERVRAGDSGFWLPTSGFYIRRISRAKPLPS